MMIIGILSYDKAIEKIRDIGEVIIKPTIDTDSGRNVNLLNIKNGKDVITNETIQDIIGKYGMNFAIQEKIKQHEKFAKLNPSSVNTIRLHTYILDGQVYSTPLAMRIGRKGSIVDNAHARRNTNRLR